jgi:ectoine hydroxylase-related dioxygenase (phytanoyl-CoA dioxygenase family)
LEALCAGDFEALARQVWDNSEPVETGGVNRLDMQAMKELVRRDPSGRTLMDEGEATDEGLFFYDVAAWARDPEVRKAASGPRLSGIAVALLGANDLNFRDDTTFVNALHTCQKTAFHQSLAYFWIKGEQCVIVCIPLERVSRENGTMQYARGSHEWAETYASNIFVSQTIKALPPVKRCPYIEACAGNYDVVSFNDDPLAQGSLMNILL